MFTGLQPVESHLPLSISGAHGPWCARITIQYASLPEDLFATFGLQVNSLPLNGSSATGHRYLQIAAYGKGHIMFGVVVDGQDCGLDRTPRPGEE